MQGGEKGRRYYLGALGYALFRYYQSCLQSVSSVFFRFNSPTTLPQLPTTYLSQPQLFPPLREDFPSGKCSSPPWHQLKLLEGMDPKLSKNSFFNLPSLDQFPDINQSLKMINTINALPIHSSLENIQIPLDHSPQQQEEDSLGERISFVPTSTNSARKKRIGCTCKKTLCLKMYCECFSSGKDCGEDCACVGCKNTGEFKEEVAQAKIAVKEGGLRSCSLAQKRCNCKKSGCLKRYCECFNSGVGCSDACKCEGCKNTEKPSAANQQQREEREGSKVENISSFPSLKKCNSGDDFSKYYD